MHDWRRQCGTLAFDVVVVSFRDARNVVVVVGEELSYAESSHEYIGELLLQLFLVRTQVGQPHGTPCAQHALCKMKNATLLCISNSLDDIFYFSDVIT